MMVEKNGHGVKIRETAVEKGERGRQKVSGSRRKAMTSGECLTQPGLRQTYEQGSDPPVKQTKKGKERKRTSNEIVAI